jgi:hypothetical protein
LLLRRLYSIYKEEESIRKSIEEGEYDIFELDSSTTPTVGTDIIEVEATLKRGENVKLNIREVGSSMASQWEHYYKGK